jgi:hypothetical protein
MEFDPWRRAVAIVVPFNSMMEFRCLYLILVALAVAIVEPVDCLPANDDLSQSKRFSQILSGCDFRRWSGRQWRFRLPFDGFPRFVAYTRSLRTPANSINADSAGVLFQLSRVLAY